MIAGLAAQAAGREESPDTTLRMDAGVSAALQEQRATLRPASAGFRVKGDAPGNARGVVARCATVHGKCHRENTASVSVSR
jgi:hypothetical protein